MGSSDHGEEINCLLHFCFRFSSKLGKILLQIGEEKGKINMLKQRISALSSSLPS